MFLGEWSPFTATTEAPLSRGSRSPTVSMKLWNIGRSTTRRSSSAISKKTRQETTFASKLLWDSIAPFGWPVVPLV